MSEALLPRPRHFGRLNVDKIRKTYESNEELFLQQVIEEHVLQIVDGS